MAEAMAEDNFVFSVAEQECLISVLTDGGPILSLPLQPTSLCDAQLPPYSL